MYGGMTQQLMEAASILNADETDFDKDGRLKQRLSFMAELNILILYFYLLRNMWHGGFKQ